LLCPSFTEMSSVCSIFKGASVEIGAQDCSNERAGSYTGQVLAESLRQIGCIYCVVGHSERREYFSESSDLVGQKALRLLQVGITPILCVGEKKIDYDSNAAKDVIRAQLDTVFEKIKGFDTVNLCIAYEPVWAVGTGIIPKNEYIEEIFDFILEISKKYGQSGEIKLLYGGSVDDLSAKTLKNVRNLGGFLIGGASLDFKKFEKIVQL